MKKQHALVTGRCARLPTKPTAAALAAAAFLALASPASHALEFQVDNPDLKAYFPNTDDSNRNFKRGLVSNRLDLLSEFDAAYKGFGVRVSAAAWRDSVHLRSNDHVTAW
ncbi:MAG TPA: DUF1302 family protein [Ramlibacter sp.]|nr:DUF1302 family protein [Ramlibacter sp.]